VNSWDFLLKTRQSRAVIGFIIGLVIVLSGLAVSVYATSNPLSTTQINSENFSQGESRLITPAEIRAVIQKARKILIAGDGTAFAALFTADGEFIVPGNRWVGRASIEKAIADFAAAYTEVQVDILQIVVEGDRAVVEWHWQDREKATGRHSRADDAIVIDFQNAQIGRWREYIDTETWVGQ
jgi:uncharacterized protein (TIGR02246 family)